MDVQRFQGWNERCLAGLAWDNSWGIGHIDIILVFQSNCPCWAMFFSPPPEPLSSQNMVNIMNYQGWRRRVRLVLWNGPILRCCFVTRGAINGPNGCMNTAGRARSDAPCSADGRRHCEPDRSLWRRVTNEARQNSFLFISCSVSYIQPVPLAAR